MKRALVVFYLAVVTAARVHAQTAAPEPPVPLPPVTPAAPSVPAPLPPVPAPAPVAPEPTEVTLTPVVADAATCLALDTTPGALMEPVAAGGLDTPIPWTEFAVDGNLLESSDAVHALLEPTMQQYRTTLSNATWSQIAAVVTKFGYQLVGHVVIAVPNGERLVLHLAPLPIVRKVNVTVRQTGAFLRGLLEPFLDDEVKRRLSVRTGSYLPWEPIRRQCALAEETQRIEDYLHDEGYAEATVRIVPDSEGNIVRLRVRVDLGTVYNIGHITIARPPGGEQLAIPDAAIKAKFHHTCYLQRCRFTRTQHQEDLQKVKELFHKRGYPSVRVQSSFDPHTSFDRHSQTVPITITIDQRRAIDVQFAGNDRDAFPDDQLREKLTFDRAGSSDDVEAAASAKAIEGFLQTRGYFDGRVTVERQRQPEFDKIIFHIDQGPTREVREIEFAGNTKLSTSKLEGVVATKAAGSILSANAAATSAQIKLDVERIKEAYRRAGYRETRVQASASTTPTGLVDAALTAALLLADQGSGDLYVRYRIEEGPPALLTRIQVDLTGPKDTRAKLCAQILHELGTELAEPQFATPTPDPTAPDACIATASNAKFREDDVLATRDRLRDFLFQKGRPRASVDYEAHELGPRHWLAHYTVRGADELRVGKVIIRGNFHTKAWIIQHELRLHEGDPLTTAALADGARRLRNTGLFDAVNIDLPDLCTNPPACDAGSNIVDAVVRVEERFDYFMAIEGDGGYSSYNGLYATGKATIGDLWGRGIKVTGLITYGQKIFDLEGTLVLPPWLVPDWVPFDFRTTSGRRSPASTRSRTRRASGSSRPKASPSASRACPGFFNANARMRTRPGWSRSHRTTTSASAHGRSMRSARSARIKTKASSPSARAPARSGSRSTGSSASIATVRSRRWRPTMGSA